MEEAPMEGKGKARKIAIQVAEQPASQPVGPAKPTPGPKPKSVLRAYLYIGIGVALVVASSFDIYTPGVRGQGAMGLLVVGGLWLAYGIYYYFRAKE